MKGSRRPTRIVALLLFALALTACAFGQPNSWTLKAHMLQSRTRGAAATGPDGRIYVFGGITQPDPSSTIGLDTAEAYDPTTDTWSPIASLPEVRADHVAITGPDGLIYIIGGKNSSILTSVYA